MVTEATHGGNKDIGISCYVLWRYNDTCIWLSAYNMINSLRQYAFGLGKRDPYAFGLGKRDPYAFGLGKRDPYAFGLGKRDPYSFGLGR